MPWESDEEKESPRRDWVKFMWIGVALLMALGIAAMFIPWPNGSYQVTRARVSHILIKFDAKDTAAKQAAVDKANKLRQQILDGVNFSKVAADNSDDTGSSGKGGDLGWVQRGELSKPIDEWVWSAPLNQVSSVFISENGLHLVIVREREVSEADKYEAELKNRVLKGTGTTDAPKP